VLKIRNSQLANSCLAIPAVSMQDDMTVLHVAAKFGSTAVAQFLLAKGVSIDAKDEVISRVISSISWHRVLRSVARTIVIFLV
jgi:hypothetical protein